MFVSMHWHLECPSEDVKHSDNASSSNNFLGTWQMLMHETKIYDPYNPMRTLDCMFENSIKETKIDLPSVPDKKG